MSERTINSRIDYIRRLETENYKLRGQAKVVPELLEVCKLMLTKWLDEEPKDVSNDEEARLIRQAKIVIETTEKTMT